ncbi:MAG TPA: HEAT repeat domain-containing protein, partial [Blastocatellia bacterium]|nr:HEAT repeat domain-containing protein [Blastocatellia bacterium]
AVELIKALMACAMAMVLNVSLSIRGFGQDQGLARQFVQSANASNAAQKLLREGRELIGERKLDAAKTKFDEFIRAYPRDKNLDAALYWLAFCLKQQGRPKEANLALVRLLKEYPRSDWQDDARALRLELAAVMGDTDAAREIFRQELEERAQKVEKETQESRDRSQETEDRSQEAKERAREARDRAREDRERSQEVKERAREDRERSRALREGNQTNLRSDDPEESLRLIALQSLFQVDPERAMAVAVGFLSADSKTSPAIQDAALGLIARHGGEKAWPALLDTARNQSVAESVREQAIYWIANQNREQAVDSLIQLYDGEKSAGLKDRLLYWLAHSDGERVGAKVVEIARNGDNAESRERAIYWIAHRSGEQPFPILSELYSAEKDSAIKERILYWFAHSGDSRAQAKVDEIARADASPELRERAIYWVAQRNGPEATDTLVRLYDEQKEEETKERILYWLGQRGGKAGLQKLFAVARSDSPQNLRERAIYYIGQSKDPEAIKLLEQILK